MDEKTKEGKGFFGHPGGLGVLFFAETFERLSYYGMKAILLFYMIGALSAGGLNMDTALSASIVSVYGALIYMSGIIGGYVSDRFLGEHKTIVYGGILIIIGDAILAFPLGEPGLYMGLLTLIIGTGLFKPNVANMVGNIYSQKDNRRDAGFTIFYMGINVGATLAPLIIGGIGQSISFHLGFGIAAIAMVLGLGTYIAGHKKYMDNLCNEAMNKITSKERPAVIRHLLGILAVIAAVFIGMEMTGTLSASNIINLITLLGLIVPAAYFLVILKSKNVSHRERTNVIVYIVVFVASIAFWAVYEQTFIIFPLFVSQWTELSFFGITLQASQINTFNALFVLLLAPALSALWTKMGQHQPSTTAKFAWGIVCCAVCFLLLVMPLTGGAKINILWIIASIFLLEIGEVILSPSGLSLTTKLSPKAFNAQMMGIWYLGDAAGQAVNAQLVKFYDNNAPLDYLLYLGTACLLVGILLFVIAPKLNKMLRLEEAEAGS